MTNAVLQTVLYPLVLLALAFPLGGYISRVMDGENVFLSRVVSPVEKRLYRMVKIDNKQEMDWKQYFSSLIIFSGLGFAVLFLLCLLQGILPLNPQGMGGTSWHLAFNTAASFVSGTNWQPAMGESNITYFTQVMGQTVQNFLAAGVGLSTAYVMIRGFTRKKATGIGNFWVDLTRSILYILLPLALVLALALVALGVVQSFAPFHTTSLLEPITLADGTVITKQIIPLGAAASEGAVKQLGTNGGGVFGANAAHPFENPSPFTNILQMLSILLIPVAMCFAFGRSIKNKKQGAAIFLAMFAVFVLALGVTTASETQATPALAQNGAVQVDASGQAGGNMEGKETRFGTASSASWAVFTTAASNGSVNAAMGSFTPMGGLMPTVLMQLGEVIFGGVGSGLFGMLAFAILAVFISGLMVGRTPAFLGKKIEPYEMKMAVIACLATPAAILVGSGIAALAPGIIGQMGNGGAHGFSELLYAFSSAGANNGSAFGGFDTNIPLLNVGLGLVMLFARFVPIGAVLAVGGNLASKKPVAENAGSLSTTSGLFVGLLVFVVLLVGALSFFPALALGPIAENLQMMGG